MGGTYSILGEMRNASKILFDMPEGRKPLRRPRCRYLKEIGWEGEGVGWIHLVQNRDQWQALVNTVMNRQVP
jgi:hypothetical protein